VKGRLLLGDLGVTIGTFALCILLPAAFGVIKLPVVTPAAAHAQAYLFGPTPASHRAAGDTPKPLPLSGIDYGLNDGGSGATTTNAPLALAPAPNPDTQTSASVGTAPRGLLSGASGKPPAHGEKPLPPSGVVSGPDSSLAGAKRQTSDARGKNTSKNRNVARAGQALPKATLSPPVTPTTTTPTPATEVPPPPVTIDSITVTSVSAFTATISWHTSLPAQAQAAYGVGALSLWGPLDSGTEHTTTLSGLYPGLTYQTRVFAADAYGRLGEQPGPAFTTAALPSAPSFTAAGGAFRVDGAPFFFTTGWRPCLDSVAGLVNGEELNLIQGSCDNLGSSGQTMLDRVNASALFLRATGDSASGGHVAGEYLPDEWDTHLPGNVSRSELLSAARPDLSRLQFLALTSHVWAGAAALPQGKGMYPTLFALADVLGSDLYPLTSMCNREALGVMFAGARDLVQQAGGKPTYQWVETAAMDCGSAPAVTPTAATVRAEAFLAIAGGVSGLGFFPADANQNPVIQAVIKDINQDAYALQPALFAPAADAQAGGAVKVGGHVLNGALYLFAVNSSFSAQTVSLSSPGLNGRTLTVIGEGRTVAAQDDSFQDHFDPLAVHIYMAAPQLG
jgi:hypothetical protein